MESTRSQIIALSLSFHLFALYERCMYFQMYKFFEAIFSKHLCEFRKDFNMLSIKVFTKFALMF